MSEIVRLLLATVLAVAGATKLVDRAGSRAAMTGFGAPRRLASPLAISLALAELVLAAGLVRAATAQPAAVATTLLLLAFVAAMSWKLLHGQRPECHCFGALHSRPIGKATLLRNAALVLAAALVAISPGAGVSLAHAVFAVATAALVTQALLWVQLLRRYGRALRRIDELEDHRGDAPALAPGDVVPAFTIPTVGGDTLSLDDLLAPELPALLVFTDLRWGACTALYPAIARWQEELAAQLTVAVLAQGGDPDELRALASEHGLERFGLADPATFDILGVDATPGAVLITPDGRVGAPLTYGAAGVEHLLLDAVEASVLEVSLHG